MKRNLLIINLMIVFFLSSSIVFCQPPKKGEKPPIPDSTKIQNMVDKLETELSLSEEQKEKMLAIHHNHFKAMKKIKQQYKGDKEKIMEERKKLKQKFKDSVNELLNDEQKEKYKLYRQKMKEKHQHKHEHKHDHDHEHEH